MYEGLSRGIASPTPSVESVDDLEDDLAIFGGQMRVLDRKGKAPHQRSPSMSSSGQESASGSSPRTPSSSVANLSPPSPSASGMLGLGLGLPDVHPSLITYLNQDAVRRVVSHQQQHSVDTVGSMGTVSSSDTPYDGPYERNHLNSGRSVSPFFHPSVGSWLLNSFFVAKYEYADFGGNQCPPKCPVN